MLIEYNLKNGGVIFLNKESIDCIYIDANYVVWVLFKSGEQVSISGHRTKDEAIETIKDVYAVLNS